MTDVAARPSPFVDWGVASLALPGERTSGDLHIVHPTADGVLVGVVDGLGHGEEAALAARRAVDTLGRFGHESVISLARRCHEALVGTRGVVMSLAVFGVAEATVTWLGIGNVEGVLVRADRKAVPPTETIVQRGGVVGYELPPLRASVISVVPKDTLFLATDGIRAGFTSGLQLQDPPQRLADQILAQGAKRTDDALVLVARYRGGGEG